MEPTGVTSRHESAGPKGAPSEFVRGRFRVRVVESTGSTNSDLAELAQSGEPGDRVLIARHQTAGRGRLDRRWEAPAGSNLLMSIWLDPPPRPMHLATQLVGLAVCRVARRHGADAALKWPNDVVVGDAKLAGVLAQTAANGIVVGVGVNVRWAPEGAVRLGDGLDPVAVGAEVLGELEDLLSADVATAQGEYRSSLSTLGRRVRVELPGDVGLEGRATDVEPDGRLVVLDSCGISHRVDTGDVVHLRTLGAATTSEPEA